MAHAGSGEQREHGLRLHVESDVEMNLWSFLFMAREIGAVATAIGVVAIADFGSDRFLIAAVLVFAILPFDLLLHWETSRLGRVPWASALSVLVAPGFLIWEPRIWLPAVLAALAAIALYALAYRLPVAAGLAAVQGGLLAGAGAIADIDGDVFVEGMVAYLVVTPALLVALNAFFQAVTASERRYRDFLQYANDMVYTHDLKTLEFLTVNEAALVRTGYTREELGQVTVADIVAPEYLARAAEMIERKLQGETDATTYDLEIVAKDGRRIPVEVSTRLIKRRGEPVAIQGIARDISERRHVEAQRLALDKARSEFIANAAHELRTPLTTLAGLASVLASTRDRMTEEELTEAVGALDRQGRRARVLADKLLDLSSVELGTIDVVREPVDVGETVERALEDAPPPDGKSVKVDVGPDLKALADPLRLQQIVSNFLTNGYRHGGDHVEIKACHEEGLVVLSVSDDGGGVPEDLRADLFEPFARGDHGDGIGLGLAICARLAEAQGGHVSFEALDPGGSRFCVRLEAAG